MLSARVVIPLADGTIVDLRGRWMSQVEQAQFGQWLARLERMQQAAAPPPPPNALPPPAQPIALPRVTGEPL